MKTFLGLLVYPEAPLGVYEGNAREKELVVVAPNEHVCGLNHEKNLLFRRFVETGVLKVRDAISLRRWS